MKTRGFDHVSLPSADPDATIAFYRKLGFPILYEDEFRAGTARWFGVQVDEHVKINFHGPPLWQNPEFTLKGPTASPGCGDLCFYFPGTIEEAEAMLRDAGCEIAFGPVDQRGGADAGQRQGTSIYTRDPDGNLLEFMTYGEPR
jgi:catechol 2,3-dioxygenase-like lactoylglutathione lyase family enzyme